MAVLGDLLHDAHCAAGGGVTARDPFFGLVQLARHACAGDGTISMERGTRIFDEFFDELARAAGRRRTRAGAAALDIAALVKELFDSGLEAAERSSPYARPRRRRAGC
eukprot:144662-Pleurochrysis_carterae.AAC.1